WTRSARSISRRCSGRSASCQPARSRARRCSSIRCRRGSSSSSAIAEIQAPGMTGLVLQQLINALTIGAIYALIALGYTMVYGVMRLINFVHGELFMLGAYVSLGLLLLAGHGHGDAGPLLVASVMLLVFLI